MALSLRKRLLLPMLAALVVAGCASNSSFGTEKDKLQTIIFRQDAQDTQLEVLRKDILAQKEKMEKLIIDIKADETQDVSRGKEALENSDISAIQDGLASLQQRAAELGKEQAEIKRQITGTSAVHPADTSQVEELHEELAEDREDTDIVPDAFTEILADLKKEPVFNPPEMTLEERSKKEEQRQESITAQYDAALALFNRNRFEEAILKFEEFLQEFPDEELSANAYYWIGEGYYSAKKWNTAADYFQQTKANFPQHPKAADASLKLAMSLYFMGNKSDAHQELLHLKEAHPDFERMDLINRYLRLTK